MPKEAKIKAEKKKKRTVRTRGIRSANTKFERAPGGASSGMRKRINGSRARC